MKTKILKIIQIVYDILSLGFIVFVIVAMAVTPKSEGHYENNVTEVVEKKAIDNYGYLDENGIQLYLMPTDYKSDYFITNFIAGLFKDYPNFKTSDNSSLNFNYCSFEFYNLDSTNNAYGTLKRTYKSLIVGQSLVSSNDNGSIYRYSLDFNTTDVPSNDSHAYKINYDVFIPFLDEHQHEIGGFQCYNIAVQYDWLGVDNLLIKENNLDAQTCPFIDYFYTPIITERGDNYNNGYQTGYSRGYNKAVTDVLNPDSTQYQYIYDLGKQEGIVEGMRGTESNAFIVIGQAFSAVGSIFSIEVLPNLPLWVLVFTPLIIVVVIVVVKLIKG